MIKNDKQFSTFNENVLRWLEALFLKRFGNIFILRRSHNCVILYSQAFNGKIVFDSLNTDFFKFGSEINFSNYYLSTYGLYSILPEPIPAPGNLNFEKPLFEFIGDDIYIHYDILGLIYWMLNRIEEIDNKNLDYHGRFTATNSHAFKYRYLDRPVVDEWLCALKQIIEIKWPKIVFPKSKFEIKLSHDVDFPSSYTFRNWLSIFKSMFFSVVKEFDFHKAIITFLLKVNYNPKYLIYDEIYSFDWIMKTSEKYGLKSAFYFLAGNTNSKFDSNYKINHPLITRLLRNIYYRGHEIGLHPSYDTFKNILLIKNELEILRSVTDENGIYLNYIGVRMHYLRFQFPLTLRNLNSLDIQYDTTLGYADMPGFRCGTCLEYQPFDPIDNKALTIKIIPLIVMDDTILSNKYLGLGTSKEGLDLIIRLKQNCVAFDGIFSLLWHNCNLDTKEKRVFYEQILSC
jgi:hypothetical protein